MFCIACPQEHALARHPGGPKPKPFHASSSALKHRPSFSFPSKRFLHLSTLPCALSGHSGVLLGFRPLLLLRLLQVSLPSLGLNALRVGHGLGILAQHAHLAVIQDL